MSDLSWLSQYGVLILRGLYTTMTILVISSIFGFLLAIPVALARISRNRLISGVALGFTSFIRGTPLLVQIYVLYYGLGNVFAFYPPIRHSFLWPFLREGYWYIVVALVISTGAYSGEIIRGGLLSVPKGELEAARSFGMTKFQVLRRVWLPRAIGDLLPTLAGETVMLLKATALASTIAVMDLLGAANLVRAQTYRVYEPLLLVAVVYLCLTLLIETGFNLLEGKGRRTPGQ